MEEQKAKAKIYDEIKARCESNKEVLKMNENDIINAEMNIKHDNILMEIENDILERTEDKEEIKLIESRIRMYDGRIIENKRTIDNRKMGIEMTNRYISLDEKILNELKPIKKKRAINDNMKKKYNNNKAYRESVKTKSKAYYHKNKEREDKRDEIEHIFEIKRKKEDNKKCKLTLTIQKDI